MAPRDGLRAGSQAHDPNLRVVGGSAVRWLSPLETDDFAEYRDDAFRRRLSVSLGTMPLRRFWPPRGPVWDGLAITDSGRRILAEADFPNARTLGEAAEKAVAMAQGV